jgi:hypothetical protein
MIVRSKESQFSTGWPARCASAAVNVIASGVLLARIARTGKPETAFGPRR